VRIDEFLAERATQLATIAPELEELTRVSGGLLERGKRFRALFCYWGWHAVSARSDELDPLGEREPHELPGVVLAAAALEMFHAAALVHDDIMDNSDTRRGAPSAHKRFEAMHLAGGWAGTAARFGRSSALLLGDLLLGWSDELFDSGTRELADRHAALAARAEFTLMRMEVTVGQYLDILEEESWNVRPESELLGRAHRVIVYKSAKYSVEAPLVIGAALGGGSSAQLASLRQFGLPIGIAFQLRDDLLGVFGDPAVTGKPAGDDLREGKRTVLIALARASLPTNARQLLDELLGDPRLDDRQIAVLQSAIRDSGAVDHVERIIAHNVGLAKAAIADAPVSTTAREQLLALADTVTRRSA
jgi:geranylgeranyl diphosphate synthase type I